MIPLGKSKLNDKTESPIPTCPVSYCCTKGDGRKTEVHNSPPPLNMELLEYLLRKIMGPTSRERIFPERKEPCIKGLGLATLACYACLPVLSIKKDVLHLRVPFT